MMRRNLMMVVLSMAAVTAAFAQGAGGMMAGSGMMVVADDGSLLVSNMDMSAMMGGGSSSAAGRELVNIGSNGAERWRVSFTEGWPMMPATDGDLVVVVLVDDWFMGFDGAGDNGWNGGGMGGGLGGGMGGGTGGGTGAGAAQATLIALDLSTGAERWRATISGDMGSMVQFAPDGSRIYVSARERGTSGMGHGSITQGQAAGSGVLISTTVVAFDRSGNQLWTFEVGGSNGTGGGR